MTLGANGSTVGLAHGVSPGGSLACPYSTAPAVDVTLEVAGVPS